MIRLTANGQYPHFDTAATLAFLHVHPEFEFYLTGSRFFGSVTSGSDWDFFVEDDGNIRAYLEQNGFRNLNAEQDVDPEELYPDDPYVARVYQRGAIQVQVVRDADLKRAAQNLIHGSPLGSDLSRSGRMNRHSAETHARRHIWRWAYAQAVKQEEEIRAVMSDMMSASIRTGGEE